MLYVTTRNRHDAYTAHRAMHEERAPDGGSYLPFRMPMLDAQLWADWNKKSFGQIVADALNLLLPAGINSWDVEFAVGRHPIRMIKMGRRVTVVQLWRNSCEDYRHIETAVAQLIYKDNTAPSEWVRIAIRMAVMAAAISLFLRDEAESDAQADISVDTDDFSVAIAAWYLRQMGAPIGNILCSCDENAAVWDLLRMGEARTDASARKTDVSDVDAALPLQLERLICGALGQEEALRYSDICKRGGVYKVAELMHEKLRAGIYVAAVSQRRIGDLLQSVHTISGCVVGPQTAKAYGGLLDYRARSGESRRTLLLEDRSPVYDKAEVCQATGLTETQLKDNLA